MWNNGKASARARWLQTRLFVVRLIVAIVGVIVGVAVTLTLIVAIGVGRTMVVFRVLLCKRQQ
jgi:hypothetical protein